MSYTIMSPSKGFTGVTEFGGGSIAFNDGEAAVSELHPGVRAYMETRGYVVEEHEDGPFSPAEHGVRDVVAHLKAVQKDDPEEFHRVFAAERDGKARKSILDQFDAPDKDESGGGDDASGSSED